MDEKGTGRKRKDLVKKLCEKLQMYHKMGYSVYYDGVLLDLHDSINFIEDEINKRDYGIIVRHCYANFIVFDNIEEYDMPKSAIIPHFRSVFRVVPKTDFDWVYG